MTSREVIKRIVEHRDAPRFGMDFLGDNPRDIIRVQAARLVRPESAKLGVWNRDPALTSHVPSFRGELMLNPMGNIYGRLDGKTKGQCVKGAFEDGWEALETWTAPVIDEENDRALAEKRFKDGDIFMLGDFPLAIFSSLRDGRKFEDALMDTALEQDNVRALLDRVMTLSLQIVDRAAKNGFDGIMLFDDMGSQTAPFFSPATFRTLFKPYYKRLGDAVHERGLKFFLHCCGKVYALVPDLIEAGVDVFQFDQPELTGSKVWADEFGEKAAFYSPVDIQKIMITGDRAKIEAGALNMVSAFRKSGSLIVKDYAQWGDINVLPEWQQWARDVVIANAKRHD